MLWGKSGAQGESKDQGKKAEDEVLRNQNLYRSGGKEEHARRLQIVEVGQNWFGDGFLGVHVS